MKHKDILNLQEAYIEVYDNMLDEVLDIPKTSFAYAKKMLPSALKAYFTGDKKTLEKRSRGAKIGMKKIEKRKNQNEEFDICNDVIMHLIDEGYADSLDSAEIILEHMSDEWLGEIMEAKWGKQPLPAEKMLRKAGRHDYYAGWLRGEYEGNTWNRGKKKKRTQEMEDEAKGRANTIRDVLLRNINK